MLHGAAPIAAVAAAVVVAVVAAAAAVVHKANNRHPKNWRKDWMNLCKTFALFDELEWISKL